MIRRIRDVPISIRVIATILVTMLVFLSGLLVWTSWQQERIAMEQARLAAQRTTEIATTGLRVVMATGEIEAQAAFLAELRRNHGGDEVRVVPGENVVRQYKAKTEAAAADAVERQVLSSGMPYFGVETRNGRLTYRAVVPVKAEGVGGKECLTCHEGERHTVLGAVSLDIGFEHVRAATRSFQRNVTLASVGLAALLLFGAYLLMTATIKRPLQAVSGQLHDVADGDGDLTRRVDARGRDEVGRLAASFNKFVDRLHEMLEQIRDTAGGVAAASDQLSAATDDLSGSVQSQAGSLDETAASLDELTATVKSNASAAQQASELAADSRTSAEHGGQVAREAVASMRAITDSSRQISSIVTAIDEIAFQTNLLALNAAVEAARAGEHGRGFAVVASEVRNLAQRSAAAAREIKTLIDDATRKVDVGADLVTRSGKSLEEIVASVARVTDLMTNIARASQEQALGLEQVNRAIAEMDRSVQGDASRSEELSATVESLRAQSETLQSLVSRFKLRDAAREVAGERRVTAPAAPSGIAAGRSGAPRARARGPTVLIPTSVA